MIEIKSNLQLQSASLLVTNGVIGLSTTSTSDLGLSRLAAGSLAIGNGTQGNTSGQITLNIINAITGFQVNGLAPTGFVLRGNGTDFVSGQVLVADLGDAQIISLVNGQVLQYNASAGKWQNVSIGALGGVNSGLSGQLAFYASSGAVVSGNSKATISNGSLTLGIVGTAGALLLSGSTSGAVTVQSAATAGTWSLTLPTSAGVSGSFLQTDGLGVTSWQPSIPLPINNLQSATGPLQMQMNGFGLNWFFTVGADIGSSFNSQYITNAIATSSANQNSPVIGLEGRYWTGATSAFDTWSIGAVLGTGPNPTSNFTFLHVGSPGLGSVLVPNLQVTGLSTLVNVSITGTLKDDLGLVGTSGQVLTSTGSGILWSSSGGSGSITSISTSGIATGGPITSTGTISVAGSGNTTTAATAAANLAAAPSGTVVTIDGLGNVQSSARLISALALVNSPTFTGTPAAPTPVTSDNTTKLATTAFVKAQGYITVSSVTSVFARTGAITSQSGDYSFSQISGVASVGQIPNLPGSIITTGILSLAVGGNNFSNLGDLIYGGLSAAPAILPGNTGATKQFLTQTGTGLISASPVWGTIAIGDLPTGIPNSNLANSSITISGDGVVLSSTGVPINLGSTGGLSLLTQTAGKIFGGPISGGASTPTFRSLVNTDLTSAVFVASGSSHTAGAVPDPGVTAGSTHFLREDSTWAIPTVGSVPWSSLLAPTGNLGSLGSPISMGTFQSFFSFGDNGAVTGSNSYLYFTDTSTSSADTTCNVVFDTGVTSYHSPFQVRCHGSTILQAYAPNGSAPFVVVGSSVTVLTLAGVSVPTKLIVMTANATHTIQRLYQQSAAATGTMQELNTVTAPGTGFYFIKGQASCSATDTTIGSGSTVFSIRGDGLATGLTIAGQNLIVGEIPSGSINGINTIFTLASSPTANSVAIYVNGLRMANTVDYTISGSTITFLIAPSTGYVILVDYLH